jgi:hypothetical protein
LLPAQAARRVSPTPCEDFQKPKIKNDPDRSDRNRVNLSGSKKRALPATKDMKNLLHTTVGTAQALPPSPERRQADEIESDWGLVSNLEVWFPNVKLLGSY